VAFERTGRRVEWNRREKLAHNALGRLGVRVSEEASVREVLVSFVEELSTRQAL
jgi:hypothetical protein